MRTLLSGLLLAALALPFGATSVLAHGGQYRGPGGALPPSLREPTDPKPPPPPPPSGAPPVTPPSKPGTAPSPLSPNTPDGGQPVTPGTDPLGGGGRTPGTRTGITPDSWVFWYEYNKDVLEELKRNIYKFGDTNPLGLLGGGAGVGSRTGARHATRAFVEKQVLPALLWAMDPAQKLHQDIESAAYIALAKVTTDPAHIEQLQKGLTSRNIITRESSVLALGLLRRERPADQFDAGTLDRIRTTLFGVYDDDAQQARTRAFAALALGLLGDQPTAEGGAARTTDELFTRLQVASTNMDMPVCVLKAIALQPAATVQPRHREVLRTAVLKRRLGTADIQDAVASYAALALGDIGDPQVDTTALLRVVEARRSLGSNLERSAVIALGKLGRRASPEDRATIARALKDGIARKRISDVTARKFAYISLAYLAQAEAQAGRTDVMGGARIGAFLIAEAADGRYVDRPFAALALSLICREIGDAPTIEYFGEFQSEARDTLRGGLASTKNDARCRAAFAIALGLAKDEISIPVLTSIVADDRADDELRGYAAIALGHIGNGSKRVLEPIRAALTSRRSERLGRSTATALGMLHDRKAVPLLLEELGRVRSQSAKGQAVIALARVGDERALPRLVEMLRDRNEQDLTRALACAGLGIVGDLEWVPSLSNISRDINYRASVDAINEVLSIL